MSEDIRLLSLISALRWLSLTLQPSITFLFPTDLRHQLPMEYPGSLLHEPLCVTCIEPLELINKPVQWDYLLNKLLRLPRARILLDPPYLLHDQVTSLSVWPDIGEGATTACHRSVGSVSPDYLWQEGGGFLPVQEKWGLVVWLGRCAAWFLLEGAVHRVVFWVPKTWEPEIRDKWNNLEICYLIVNFHFSLMTRYTEVVLSPYIRIHTQIINK